MFETDQETSGMSSKLDLEKDTISPDGQAKSEPSAIVENKGRAITGFRVKTSSPSDWSAMMHFVWEFGLIVAI